MAQPSADDFREQVLANWTDPQTFGAWERWHDKVSRQQQAVSDALAAAAAIGPGSVVLDLASGSGEPAISFAAIAGETGRVVATDVSEGMLAVARANAERAGANDMTFTIADAERLPFESDSFDAVTSRMGIMFFVDVPRALAEIKRVLRPNGRAAFAVWGLPQEGTFWSRIEPFTRYFTPPAPPPGAPQPFRFAQPGSLSSALAAAGFSGLCEETRVMPMPWYGTPEENWQAFDELATPAWIEELPETQRRAGLAEVLAQLRDLHDGEAVRMTAAVVIASATAA